MLVLALAQTDGLDADWIRPQGSSSHTLLGILEPPVAVTVQVGENTVRVRETTPRSLKLRHNTPQPPNQRGRAMITVSGRSRMLGQRAPVFGNCERMEPTFDARHSMALEEA